MSFEKQVKLATVLYSKTMDGTMDWKPSARDNTFQVSFSSYTLRLSQDGRNDEPDYTFELLNEDGDVADAFSDNDLIASGYDAPQKDENEITGWYRAIGDLYSRARRIALGADKAIDAILSELDGD